MYEICFRGTPPCARTLAYVRERCQPEGQARQGGLHYRVTVEPSTSGPSFAVEVCARSAGRSLEARAAHDDVIRALEQAFGGV